MTIANTRYDGILRTATYHYSLCTRK